MANDLVLITGATGFVGSAVVRQALKRGWQVRVLVRARSVRSNIAGLPLQIALGDLRDAAAMQAALAGVRYLFHVAADYRLWARDPEDIVHNNVNGSETLMNAALAAKVERIVYTSSVATLRVAGAYSPVREDAVMTPQEAIGAYKRSKVLAEQMIVRKIAQDGLPAIIVNPSTPIGPRDLRPTPTGRIIVQAAQGKIPAFVDTGINLVHVEDVAVGHLLALERGMVGERYILGGQNLSLQAMLADVATLVGRRAPRIRLARWPLYPLAYMAQSWARVSGKEPFLTTDGLAMAKYRMFFSSDKAQRELGYQARPYQQGLLEALNWFRSEGYLF